MNLDLQRKNLTTHHLPADVEHVEAICRELVSLWNAQESTNFMWRRLSPNNWTVSPNPSTSQSTESKPVLNIFCTMNANNRLCTITLVGSSEWRGLIVRGLATIGNLTVYDVALTKPVPKKSKE